MSKFDIYLNTEKPAVVEKLIDVYPFAGVCCNPQICTMLLRIRSMTLIISGRSSATRLH